jgi:hypothetical protein
MWAEAGGQACLAQHYQPEQATGCPDGDRENPEAYMQPYTQSSIDTYSMIALANQQASSQVKSYQSALLVPNAVWSTTTVPSLNRSSYEFGSKIYCAHRH